MVAVVDLYTFAMLTALAVAKYRTLTHQRHASN